MSIWSIHLEWMERRVAQRKSLQSSVTLTALFSWYNDQVTPSRDRDSLHCVVKPLICPLRCYCADSALCSHIDLQILGTAARVRTPGTKSSCPVQPAVVRVSDAVSVARGSHAAVRDPTRVLNADWPTRAWNRPRREHCTSGFLRQSGLVHVIRKSVTPPQIRGQVLQPNNWCSIASLRFWSLIHANVCYCFDSECKRHFP